jgi:hypothetical protein
VQFFGLQRDPKEKEEPDSDVHKKVSCVTRSASRATRNARADVLSR